MNLVVVAGSIGRTVPYTSSTVEVLIEDVELERLLDDIGEERVMEHFDLVRRRF